jgi:hypothetical protein
VPTTTNIYCDFAAGNDTTGDGSISLPYKTFQKGVDAATGAVPGDGADKTIWLKNTASYTEEVTVTEAAVAAQAAPLIVEGYTTTPGDGGMATLDGENTRLAGFALFASGNANVYYWVFKNIYWKRYTDAAVDSVFGAGGGGSALMQQFLFKHCRFSDNLVAVYANTDFLFEDCWFHDNVTAVDGAWWLGSALRCIVENNTNGFLMSKNTGGSIWNSLFIGNTNYNLSIEHGIPVVNCVIDGSNKASAIGIKYPNSTSCIPKILNTIIIDCTVAVEGYGAGAEELSAIFNSCFFLNGSDFTNGAGQRTGCVFADPLFVNKAIKDYGIGTLSPCKEAGMDLKLFDYLTSTASRVDIGLLQENRVGSGDGSIGAPLHFSVEH